MSTIAPYNRTRPNLLPTNRRDPKSIVKLPLSRFAPAKSDAKAA